MTLTVRDLLAALAADRDATLLAGRDWDLTGIVVTRDQYRSIAVDEDLFAYPTGASLTAGQPIAIRGLTLLLAAPGTPAPPRYYDARLLRAKHVCETGTQAGRATRPDEENL